MPIGQERVIQNQFGKNYKFINLFNFRIELSSEEFYHQLRPFLFEKTEHFVHEFISFARSPFDLNTYDQHAQYSWYDESQTDPVRDTPTVFHSSTTGLRSSSVVVDSSTTLNVIVETVLTFLLSSKNVYH